MRPGATPAMACFLRGRIRTGSWAAPAPTSWHPASFRRGRFRENLACSNSCHPCVSAFHAAHSAFAPTHRLPHTMDRIAPFGATLEASNIKARE